MDREAYSAKDIAQADALNDILMDMLSRGSTDRWREFREHVNRYLVEPWYKEGALEGTDSTLAAVLESGIPLFLTYLGARPSGNLFSSGVL